MSRVFLAVVGTDREHHAVLPGDLGQAGAEVEADTVLAVQLGEDLAQLGADDVVQRGGRRLDDGDLGAVAAGGRRDLQADPAPTRDDEPAVVAAQDGEHLAQPVGVGEAAQMVDAGQVGAGDVEAARLGAGGEQEFVVVEDGALAQPYGLGIAVDGDDGLAEVQFDVGLGVPGGFMDEDAVALLLARQIALGQGRAFIGVVAFVTDEDHSSGEPFGAEGLGGLGSGQPTADDDECPMCVDHLMPPLCFYAVQPSASVPHGA